jgi:hypothetical protein
MVGSVRLFGYSQRAGRRGKVFYLSLSLLYTHSALKCDYTLFCSRDAEEEVDARRMLLVAVIDILRKTGDFLRGNAQKL